MLNIEASEARVLSSQGARMPRHMPAIVWRSQVKPAPAAMPAPLAPRRLHLVTRTPEGRYERQRSKRLVVRDRVVESAYIAAALGTAIVIWWSAR